MKLKNIKSKEVLRILQKQGIDFALIYSSALKNNSMLVTLDNDFKGLTGALTLKG